MYYSLVFITKTREDDCIPFFACSTSIYIYTARFVLSISSCIVRERKEKCRYGSISISSTSISIRRLTAYVYRHDRAMLVIAEEKEDGKLRTPTAAIHVDALITLATFIGRAAKIRDVCPLLRISVCKHDLILSFSPSCTLMARARCH